MIERACILDERRLVEIHNVYGTETSFLLRQVCSHIPRLLGNRLLCTLQMRRPVGLLLAPVGAALL